MGLSATIVILDDARQQLHELDGDKLLPIVLSAVRALPDDCLLKTALAPVNGTASLTGKPDPQVTEADRAALGSEWIAWCAHEQLASVNDTLSHPTEEIWRSLEKVDVSKVGWFWRGEMKRNLVQLQTPDTKELVIELLKICQAARKRAFAGSHLLLSYRGWQIALLRARTTFFGGVP